MLAEWKHGYNTVRQRKALGNLQPAEYADRSVPGKQRDGALRYTEGSTPHPVASASLTGSNDVRTLPLRWMSRGTRVSTNRLQLHHRKLDCAGLLPKKIPLIDRKRVLPTIDYQRKRESTKNTTFDDVTGPTGSMWRIFR